jgi:probable HAF family extracellular repeat protein
MGFSRCSSLLLAALALIPAAHAQSTYRLTRIGDESFSPAIEDINEKNELVGSIIGDDDERRAILLRDGLVIELGDLMGGASPDAVAVAINDLTQITGTSAVQNADGNFGNRGFLWNAGEIRDLGTSVEVVALDINNRGQVVGVSTRGPFLWEEGRTTFLEFLPECPTPNGVAVAINENEVIVGQSQSFVGLRAVMWRDGEIMVLEPTIPLQSGEAVDVNDQNDVVGFYTNPGPQNFTTFLWRDTGVTVLPQLDGPDANASIPASINNLRQIVGRTEFATGQVLATLWQDNAVFDLNELVRDDDPAKPFVKLESASRITDSGFIVAIGLDARDDQPSPRYFLLTPAGTRSAIAPPAPPSSPSPSSSDADSGGGAVDLLSLLLLILGLSSVARSQRAR